MLAGVDCPKPDLRDCTRLTQDPMVAQDLAVSDDMQQGSGFKSINMALHHDSTIPLDRIHR